MERLTQFSVVVVATPDDPQGELHGRAVQRQRHGGAVPPPRRSCRAPPCPHSAAGGPRVPGAHALPTAAGPGFTARIVAARGPWLPVLIGLVLLTAGPALPAAWPAAPYPVLAVAPLLIGTGVPLTSPALVTARRPRRAPPERRAAR